STLERYASGRQDAGRPHTRLLGSLLCPSPIAWPSSCAMRLRATLGSVSAIADRRMILGGYRLADSLKQMITPAGFGYKGESGGTLLDRGTKALIVGPAWVGGHMQFKRVARVPLERCVKGRVELRRRPAVPDPFTLAASRRDRCQDANSSTF